MPVHLSYYMFAASCTGLQRLAAARRQCWRCCCRTCAALGLPGSRIPYFLLNALLSYYLNFIFHDGLGLFSSSWVSLQADAGSPDDGGGPHGLLAFLEVGELHRRIDSYNQCTTGVPMELLVRPWGCAWFSVSNNLISSLILVWVFFFKVFITLLIFFFLSVALLLSHIFSFFSFFFLFVSISLSKSLFTAGSRRQAFQGLYPGHDESFSPDPRQLC